MVNIPPRLTVEGLVKLSRANSRVPIPNAPSFDELNAMFDGAELLFGLLATISACLDDPSPPTCRSKTGRRCSRLKG